jgi:hypothetical protein
LRRETRADTCLHEPASVVECGRISHENERGWTARLTTDNEVLVYCSECDEGEFGVNLVDEGD